MVESNIDVIEEILTDLQNNAFSNLTSSRIVKAMKGLQFIQKPFFLPELENIPFILEFFHEHLKKKAWMKEIETMNRVKDAQLEGAKKEMEICKIRLRELKEQGLLSRVKSSGSFRSSTESLNQLPTTLGLIQTIVEEEESMERLNNMTRSSSFYINDSTDETLGRLRKQIQERDQTFRVMEEKLQNFEQIVTHFSDGKTAVNAGSDQGSGMTKKRTEEEKLRENNTDLLNRLSRMASEKLRDGNPNITDLGDPNRPTKLAEQFSELYDNEWTDAFEELSNTVPSEEQRINTLLETVMTAFHHCDKAAGEQFENLKKALRKEMLFASDSKNDDETGEEQNVVFDEVLFSLWEIRKHCAIVSLPKLKQRIAENVGGRTAPKSEQDTKLQFYTDRCVELTWRMCIQNPPMYLYRCEAGVPREDNFRSYTRSGTVVEYCVWPCVYLHKGGHLMMKGVAQMTEPSQREK